MLQNRISLSHLLRRFKSNSSINVSNYETGFNAPKQSLVDELDLLSLSYSPESSTESSSKDAGKPESSSFRRPNRSAAAKYPTGSVAKQRCYNCGQIGHISFDCQQPQVRKACYTCGNSGHLARDCPQSQRPIICYVCRQPGHLASKCPNTPNSQNRPNQ